jgi:hypothetical protein
MSNKVNKQQRGQTIEEMGCKVDAQEKSRVASCMDTIRRGRQSGRRTKPTVGKVDAQHKLCFLIGNTSLK